MTKFYVDSYSAAVDEFERDARQKAVIFLTNGLWGPDKALEKARSAIQEERRMKSEMRQTGHLKLVAQETPAN